MNVFDIDDVNFIGMVNVGDVIKFWFYLDDEIGENE